MIDCGWFYNKLNSCGVTFFTGVPDSLLKAFCAFVTDHVPSDRHIVAANEGNSIGLAIGHYLATGNPSLVYMQNSGQGNAINPIASLADPDVYGIPMILLVGWRGEPGTQDEPQHVKSGAVTLSMFEALGVPTSVLPSSKIALSDCVERAVARSLEETRPVALIVRKGLFEDYIPQQKKEEQYSMSREEAIELIASALDVGSIIVATTGKASRELYEFRSRQNSGHQTDFLVIGGMGHAAQIAAGIAMEKPQRVVCCFDGDGAVLMHMGGLGVVASLRLENYKHVVLNNGAHDSVGGQPTVGFAVDLSGIAKHCGYSSVFTVSDENELRRALPDFLNSTGPVFMEVRVSRGSRSDLGRPAVAPHQSKKNFMEFLNVGMR